MKKILALILVSLSLQIVFAQDNLPSNSFEHAFKNTAVNYQYIEDKQIHNYSGNWDFDGDGIKDSILFVGNGGVHLYFSLFINLSSVKKGYSFKFISIDFPLLESFSSFRIYNSESAFPKFVVHDFNDDGLLDIFLNLDSKDELQKLGVTSTMVILSYEVKNKKFIFKNYAHT